ncbi:uncharacterized protein TRIADDRAFT_61641 [Trichoplax adhaerens]|uniref:Uncharacterized protein n=1 Tax=Trichoplax adhaerens TaxID=10228 RepID=B3SBJ8_TRIAD|nr:predicted protein [Trichoplax adhaerens]EDV19869.1 predicted protein [Trichoplax adhaerens]|eukprot:XP_002117611.1 predicted protein [Trichoplax adhaerens]
MAALTTLIQIWLTLLSIGILGQSDCRQLSLLANMTVVEKIAFESLGRQMCIGKYIDYQYFNARCIQNDPSPGLYQKCREGCLIPILNINFWNTKYQCRSLCFARAKDFTLATCMLACNSLDVMRDHLSDYLKLRFKPYLLPEIATKYNRSLASINFEHLPIKKPAPHDKGPTLLPATELKAKEEIMKRIVDPDSSITIPKMCINQAQINLAKQVQAPKDYFGYTLTWGFQGGDDNCKILKRTTTAFTIVFDKEVPSLCPPIHVTITTYPAKPRSYISENVYFNRDIMKHLPNCHAIIKEVPTSNNMVIKTAGTTHYPGFTNGN